MINSKKKIFSVLGLSLALAVTSLPSTGLPLYSLAATISPSAGIKVRALETKEDPVKELIVSLNPSQVLTTGSKLDKSMFEITGVLNSKKHVDISSDNVDYNGPVEITKMEDTCTFTYKNAAGSKVTKKYTVSLKNSGNLGGKEKEITFDKTYSGTISKEAEAVYKFTVPEDTEVNELKFDIKGTENGTASKKVIQMQVNLATDGYYLPSDINSLCTGGNLGTTDKAENKEPLLHHIRLYNIDEAGEITSESPYLYKGMTYCITLYSSDMDSADKLDYSLKVSGSEEVLPFYGYEKPQKGENYFNVFSYDPVTITVTANDKIIDKNDNGKGYNKVSCEPAESGVNEWSYMLTRKLKKGDVLKVKISGDGFKTVKKTIKI